MSIPRTIVSQVPQRPARASRWPRLAGVLMVLAALAAMAGRSGRVHAAQGDLNCDGVVSVLDVPPFVLGLIDPAAYAVAFPTCDVTRADVDGNAETDGRDIKAFVSLLLSPPPQEIVLRDSIGTSSGWTDGNLPWDTWSGWNHQSWALSPITITSPVSLTLTEFRAITSQMTYTPINYSGYDYYIRGWTPSGFDQNPLSGNLFNIQFDAPTIGPSQFGTTGELPFEGTFSTYYIGFDLSGAGVHLSAGETVIVTLDAYTGGYQEYGVMGILESQESGTSDLWCSESLLPPSCYTIDDYGPPWNRWHGRLAVRIVGQSN